MHLKTHGINDGERRTSLVFIKTVLRKTIIGESLDVIGIVNSLLFTNDRAWMIIARIVPGT